MRQSAVSWMGHFFGGGSSCWAALRGLPPRAGLTRFAQTARGSGRETSPSSSLGSSRVLLALGLLALLGCSGGVAVPGHDGATKTEAGERAARRAFDGAPPVAPHEDFGVTCLECHNSEGVAVEGIGFAPASPHGETAGMSEISRCQQCHVFRQTDEVFVESQFVGLPQDLRRGRRLHALAPPVIPHRILMRENCLACHSGPAAREEIRTTHPERVRCRQCHVEQTTTVVWQPTEAAGGS